jgi:hypothetical protein
MLLWQKALLGEKAKAVATSFWFSATGSKTTKNGKRGRAGR